MENQLSLDDIRIQNLLESQPSRYAYIDESGNFGFDFSIDGTSKYYILCAVIVQDGNLEKLHNAVEAVRVKNFNTQEMKSSLIGSNYKRRTKILSELLLIDFRVILLVVDKQTLLEGSPLTVHKKSFIKFLHQRLYDTLYCVYPKLKIIEDEIGSSEFQESFKKYVAENRPAYNLLNEYDFDYANSKDSLLVQLADIIGGSINKYFTEADSPNYLEMLMAKIIRLEEFPRKGKPYFASTKPEESKYDKDIFALSLRCAKGFISKYKDNDTFEKKMQVAFIRYLLFQVQNVDGNKYIHSGEIISMLREYTELKVTKDFLYRRVIAQLRDAGVIIASCTQGYKIPTTLDDITVYLNQTHTVVSPMLNRIGICRKLVLQQTDKHLDILNDNAFIRYKRFFD